MLAIFAIIGTIIDDMLLAVGVGVFANGTGLIGGKLFCNGRLTVNDDEFVVGWTIFSSSFYISRMFIFIIKWCIRRRYRYYLRD
jgi:hypothetical protein